MEVGDLPRTALEVDLDQNGEICNPYTIHFVLAIFTTFGNLHLGLHCRFKQLRQTKFQAKVCNIINPRTQ